MPLPTQKKTSFVEIELRPALLYAKFVGPQVGQRESPIISQEIDPYIAQAGKSMKHFVIDLQGVTFMSSMGLGICIALRNKAAAHGAKPILYGTSKDLQQAFALMKIDRLFSYAANQRELDALLR